MEVAMNDNQIVKKAVEKVMKDFDYEIEDVLDASLEEINESIREEILENIETKIPHVDWIELVELDEAETHKNKNGDFLSN